MTRYTQTHGFTAKNHVEEVKNYLGRYPDVVIVNSAKIPAKILKSYKTEKGYPVVDDVSNSEKNYKVIKERLISVANTKANTSDVIRRSLLVHDREKLTEILLALINNRTYTT
jgi:ribosomal protein L10